VTGRCPCPICNAPEPEATCFDCNAPLDYEDAYEDARGNPVCGECFDKMVMKAEAASEGDR